MIGQLGRTSVRFVLLVFSLAQISFDFLVLKARLRGRIEPLDRALWLQRSCRLLLRRLGIDVTAHGNVPRQGLIVSNHLGYLDILVFGATLPCVFVSKSEVRSWPLFGPLVRCAGTIFLDRSSHNSALAVSRRMQQALASRLPVLLFPEGTSTAGDKILRFHSSLIDAAVRAQSPLTAAAISYAAADSEESGLCYYGDDWFLPHLLRTLGRDNIQAQIRFASESRIYTDRKSAAASLWLEVTALRAASRNKLAGAQQQAATSYSSLST